MTLIVDLAIIQLWKIYDAAEFLKQRNQRLIPVTKNGALFFSPDAYASHAFFAFFELMRTFCVKISERLRTSADSCGLMRIVSRNFGTLYQNTCVLPRRNDYFDQKVVIRSGTIQTSKADAENHGIGIANVRRAAEKYHGYLDLECDDHCFTAEVGLMLNTEERK